MKQLLGVHDAVDPHWIGDGFPVVSLFSYQRHGAATSPFLQLDYAGPRVFAPATKQRGIGAHPHRGIETVTFCFQGEMVHRDSAGQGGFMKPGDVQWMTAGGGVLHEELHSAGFTQAGGTLEACQLWINLPARLKWMAPAYQPLAADALPVVALPGGSLRLVAGAWDGLRGPARTQTPMTVWALELGAGARFAWPVPAGWSALFVVFEGAATVNGGARVAGPRTAIFDRAGETVAITAETALRALLLAGEPIDEPLAGQGPFVMNTREELEQAFADVAAGRFGRLPD